MAEKKSISPLVILAIVAVVLVGVWLYLREDDAGAEMPSSAVMETTSPFAGGTDDGSQINGDTGSFTGGIDDDTRGNGNTGSMDNGVSIQDAFGSTLWEQPVD